MEELAFPIDTLVTITATGATGIVTGWIEVADGDVRYVVHVDDDTLDGFHEPADLAFAA